MNPEARQWSPGPPRTYSTESSTHPAMSGVLSNDWVVRHATRVYQVQRQNQHHAPAKSQVSVCEWEDGTMEIHYQGQKLKWKEIEGRAEARKTEDPEHQAGKAADNVAKRPRRPGPDHPLAAELRRADADPAVVGSAPPGGSAGVVGLGLPFAINARLPGSQGFVPAEAHDQKIKDKTKREKQKRQKQRPK